MSTTDIQPAFDAWLENWLESHKPDGVAYSRYQLRDAFRGGVEAVTDILHGDPEDEVSEAQYELAKQMEESAQAVIRLYGKQKQARFDVRYQAFERGEQPFTEDELRFSLYQRCDCGYGLAYPKACGAWHHWDCAGILMDKADETYQHTAKLPFALYDIKSERDGETTRGTVVPNPEATRINVPGGTNGPE